MTTLYHYTSLHTLCAIVDGIENGIMYLRAGNAENMNDPNDCYYFINMLAELMSADEGLVKKMKEEKRKYDCPYLVSLTKHSDDLHMWNCYGDDGYGIAIGINSIQEIVYDFFTRTRQFSKLYRCLYLDVKGLKKNESLLNMIREVKLSDGKHKRNDELSGVSNVIKHPCYRYEKEYRIVILHGEKEHISEKEKVYHESEDAFYIGIPLKCISKIVVGPNADCNAIRKVFSPFFPKIKFEESKIPYRK